MSFKFGIGSRVNTPPVKSLLTSRKDIETKRIEKNLEKAKNYRLWMRIQDTPFIQIGYDRKNAIYIANTSEGIIDITTNIVSKRGDIQPDILSPSMVLEGCGNVNLRVISSKNIEEGSYTLTRNILDAEKEIFDSLTS